MKLVFATHNRGKISEMKKILRDVNADIFSADEVGIKEDILEDGLSFEENALIKARYVKEHLSKTFIKKAKNDEVWVFSDDSGVCISSLGHAPGVFSARWARKRGKKRHPSGKDLLKHTLHVMKHVPKNHRGAWMETCCALVGPNGDHYLFVGRVHGVIAEKPRGKFNSKLPYDVIFVPNGFKKTFAQMTKEKKNELSHRGQAFNDLKKFLKERSGK